MSRTPSTTASRWSTVLLSVVLAAVAVVTSACAAVPGVRPSASGATPVVPAGAHPTPTTADGSTCGDPTASLPPPARLPAPRAMPVGTWMAHIQGRGYLIAGVDQNTYLWGYLDPRTGQYSGFDIDMLRQVSQAIFGTPDAIHFVVVPTGDRVQAVEQGTVDIVAETMTINCQRDRSVDFSTVYYQAGQEILVPSDSTITGPADLAGKRVCATDGSTSLDNLAALDLKPAPILWAVPDDTDCLVMLQQGQVDAISTDNVILQGLKAQDPNTTIVGPAFTEEPYGMAISKAHPEFTSFVNGVLAAERSDGTWTAIYNRWLGPFTSGPAPAPPQATYRTDP
jgi:polar amino acid transport system substrate-binding protein